MSANLPLINKDNKNFVYAAGVAVLAAGAAVMSPWEATRIIGMTVLGGAGYGIINDSFACRDCIEYFTVGHRYDGRNLRNRPLNTLNPNLNAIAWGVIATWHVCAIAGAIFALLARSPIPGLAIKLTAMQLAPYLAIGVAITLLVSHVASRRAQTAMNEGRATGWQYVGVPQTLQAGWHACNMRNTTAYASLGLGTLIFSTAMVAARIGLIIL